MHADLQMHVAERQSIPNLPAASSAAAGLPPTITFDSLKSLPQRDYLQPHYQSQQQPPGESLFVVMSEHIMADRHVVSVCHKPRMDMQTTLLCP